MLISLNQKSLWRVILFSLALIFCAHAFCYANLSFSGPSVMVDASSSNASLTAGGQFLAVLYWRIRGSLASPMLMGLLSALYLTASAVLTADMLGISGSGSLFALCGALTLHISVTAINAAMLHMADVYFLSFLFAALGAWLCLRHPLGFLPAVFCAAASFGLQSGLAAVLPALVLLAALLRVLRGNSVRSQLIMLVKACISLASGFAGYAAAALLYARRQGIELSAGFRPTAANPVEAFLLSFRTLFTPATAYAAVCAVLYAVLLVLCLYVVLTRMKALSSASRIFAGAAMLMLPLVLSMPVFAESAPDAVCGRYAMCLLPVAIAALLDLLPKELPHNAKRTLQTLVNCAFGITFLSSIVFANQVYLKKNLEYQTTLSIMTRVIEQAEQTEGFSPGHTPTAIVGTLEDSAIDMAHKGFEHLAVLDAAANNYTASTQEENTWYFWSIMGYPFNFVSDVQRDALASTESVRSMPAFPQRGFCSMLDGTLVIKLSPVQ